LALTLGEEQLVALIQESLAVAHKTGALATRDLERVVVDTTVQPKAIAHPTDARLCHRALEKLVDLARLRGATMCRCGRATGASPNARRSWSGATRMRTSSSGLVARSNSCASGSAA
jgi:hypothetical protein